MVVTRAAVGGKKWMKVVKGRTESGGNIPATVVGV